jgi:hypothetical protein
MSLYEYLTKEELIKKIQHHNQLPTKDELNDEITRLKKLLIEERNSNLEKLKEDIIPKGKTLLRSYLFTLEENNQLHKELEDCRDLIEKYIKVIPSQ